MKNKNAVQSQTNTSSQATQIANEYLATYFVLGMMHESTIWASDEFQAHVDFHDEYKGNKDNMYLARLELVADSIQRKSDPEAMLPNDWAAPYKNDFNNYYLEATN